MVTYYCCGCRAGYPAQPKRCPRCKGRSFTGVNDDSPTTALLDADAPIIVPEDLDGELAAAFAASERFRLGALSGRTVRACGAFGTGTPDTGQCTFDRGHEGPHSWEPASAPVEGWPGHLSDVVKAQGDDAPATPRDMPSRPED